MAIPWQWFFVIHPYFAPRAKNVRGVFDFEDHLFHDKVHD